ncbi:hypothetical protein WJX84_011406 [Apatococcus fuscideae]|uniref:RING-type E3 ubiquitin transferase n=1 Tax=Apatococcus fuscideae TaxID=2026836 RepID=A0AAW1SUC3_9CHLO
MEASCSTGLPEDPDVFDDGHCSICLANTLRQPTTLGPCGHSFCLECIRQWTASRVDPKCPLCNTRVLSLCHTDHEEEPVEGQSSSAARQVVEAVDLSCLDHAYFHTEIQRLLQRTLATQGWINRRSRGGGGEEAVRMAEAGSALRNVQTSLASFGSTKGQAPQSCSLYQKSSVAAGRLNLITLTVLR